MALTATRTSPLSSTNVQENRAASRNETSSHLASILPPPSLLGGETISGAVPCATQSSLRRRLSSSSNNIEYDMVRQLDLESHFTPVNSTTENSVPFKPKRTFNFYSFELSGTNHQSHARNCRLIGFTPLVEEDFNSSEESCMQFLGPRKVKAKEVAPCALFYKRADVFVSSEMKSQNVLASSENHYNQIQFDNEVSIRELEYTDRHSDNSKKVAAPKMSLGDEITEESQEDGFVKIKPELPSVHLEPVGRSFAKDGLTSMPLTYDTTPGFQYDCKPFQFYADDTGRPFRSEHKISSVGGYSCDPASDPEQPSSSMGSSGIQSNLWDSFMTSSNRAASPVSSIYSSTSSSCRVEPLAKSTPQDPATPSHYKLTNSSVFGCKTKREDKEILSSRRLCDWRQDNGSLADDENDSDNSSNQLESDDE